MDLQKALLQSVLAPGHSLPFLHLPTQRAEQDASQRQCCLSACQTLFAKVPAAARIGLSVCKQPGLIVYNLFSLEGFHLAEAFGLISVVASPCAPPSSAPPGFWDAMAAEDPEFVSSLQASRLPFMRRGGCGNLVSRAHIHEWMWPLFADYWGIWRTAVLNLPASPCQLDRTAAPMLLLGEVGGVTWPFHPTSWLSLTYEKALGFLTHSMPIQLPGMSMLCRY